MEPTKERTAYRTGTNTPEVCTLGWNQQTKGLYVGLQPTKAIFVEGFLRAARSFYSAVSF